MSLAGFAQYYFWDWCIRQSNLSDTIIQKNCVHDFGNQSIIKTTLGFSIWQCNRCKKLNIRNNEKTV